MTIRENLRPALPTLRSKIRTNLVATAGRVTASKQDQPVNDYQELTPNCISTKLKKFLRGHCQKQNR
jgi:hypothetical protein